MISKRISMAGGPKRHLPTGYALFSNFEALRPTGGISHHAIYDFMVGLNFYPARNARSTTVAGRAWMPYMPVANNGSFLVDSNQTF